jgi:hypothetical protein
VARARRFSGGSQEGNGMFSTGDINPQASGSASIGVNQVDGIGGFNTNIKPYAHIHINSGVWHDPTNGEPSGVLRFGVRNEQSTSGPPSNPPGFELSFDGGASFPLRICGSRKSLYSGSTIQQMTPGAFTLHSSGLFRIDSELSQFLSTIDGGISISTAAPSLSDGDILLDAFNGIQLQVKDGDIDLTSFGFKNRGGQITLSSFASSGRLDFQFGPHQGWYSKLTHASTGGPKNNGSWPLPHSGQMLEQIVRREKGKSITIERPAVNNDLTWFYTNQAITISEVESVLRGSFDASGLFAIRYSSNRSLAGTELTTIAITCTNRTTGQITSSFAAPNIPADNWVWIAVSGVSGVATSQLHVTVHFN